MAWEIIRDAGPGRGRDVIRACGIEARDLSDVEVFGGDIGDVGTGEESLVLRPVKVCRIADLDSGVGAGGNVEGGVFDVVA